MKIIQRSLKIFNGTMCVPFIVLNSCEEVMEEILGEREMRIEHAKTNVDSMNWCVVCAMRTVLYAVIIIIFIFHSVKQHFIYDMWKKMR